MNQCELEFSISAVGGVVICVSLRCAFYDHLIPLNSTNFHLRYSKRLFIIGRESCLGCALEAATRHQCSLAFPYVIKGPPRTTILKIEEYSSLDCTTLPNNLIAFFTHNPTPHIPPPPYTFPRPLTSPT